MNISKLALAPLAGLLALLAVLMPTGAQARERIVTFDADITVHEDASMTVIETIAVEAERRKIRRGIYRDFPTTYRTRRGTQVRVGFQVIGVTRNGRTEPYRTERRTNGVRVYIGRKNRSIRRGRHVYVITYRTDRQLGFFDGFDELYWNVTGNGWGFEIGRASARIHLPKGARVSDHAAYTGPKGTKGKDYKYVPQADESAYFETTRRLRPREGLTVAVSWPPGFVARPSDAQRLAHFIGDNSVLFAGFLGLGMLLVYYLPVWVMVGRDPETGTIVPLYAPPKGFSPAAARYVTRMGFDGKVFTAAIVSMAVKGFLTIEEKGDGSYRLEKTGRKAALSMGEQAVARKLFARGRDNFTIKQANHKTLQAAQKALKAWLRTEFEKIYFARNGAYFYPGLGLSVLALLIMVGASHQVETAAFISVWLAIWSVAVYFLFRKVLRAWQGALSSGSVMSGFGAGFLTLFALPFFGAEAMGLWQFADATSLGAAVILLAILLANFLFYHLLKAPTFLGRRMMDQIEGFADYLSVAEKDRMNLLNPPDRTPELFEKFLPYALALGVEQAWSEQFAGVLAQAGTPDGTGRRPYQPHWYSGGNFGTHGYGDLASSLGGGFAGTVDSASTAPGSSGGSGGGGSSGGGGGGGGGGGW
ncbi:MAG: DUF2207 domain-containing protein [Alphaproteobacteria bacterium]